MVLSGSASKTEFVSPSISTQVVISKDLHPDFFKTSSSHLDDRDGACDLATVKHQPG